MAAAVADTLIKKRPGRPRHGPQRKRPLVGVVLDRQAYDTLVEMATGEDRTLSYVAGRFIREGLARTLTQDTREGSPWA